jgi:N-acetyl-anhydromuramyl-L-alanine amidase AmpD
MMGRNYLDDVEWRPSPNHSSRHGVKPRMIVLHYTADTGTRAVEFFEKEYYVDARGRKRRVNASAHFVVQRDGGIYQMVELDRSAWHAGFAGWPLRLHAIKPNRSSVGIEIVNAGELNGEEGDYYTWFDEEIPDDEVMIYDGQPYQTYAREQIIAVAQLVTFLCAELGIERRFMFDGQKPVKGYDCVPYFLPYGLRLGTERFKNNSGVCGHCHISKGKADPGPAITLWKGALGIK